MRFTVRPTICSAKWCHSSWTVPISTNVSPMRMMAVAITHRAPYRSIIGPTSSAAIPPRNEPMDIGIV